ncbi:hypothetical protein ON010_g15911 [Phytophthora cinnamomi]|nr:hypothetical protein ON010_g15911 [Phytophthora cinnamomi]
MQEFTVCIGASRSPPQFWRYSPVSGAQHRQNSRPHEAGVVPQDRDHERAAGGVQGDHEDLRAEARGPGRQRRRPVRQEGAGAQRARRGVRRAGGQLPHRALPGAGHAQQAAVQVPQGRRVRQGLHAARDRPQQVQRQEHGAHLRHPHPRRHRAGRLREGRGLPQDGCVRTRAIAVVDWMDASGADCCLFDSGGAACFLCLQRVAEAAARDVQQPAVQAQGQRDAGQGAA